MALQISLSSLQQNSCSELILSDTTGAYSATNTGGWGTPNLEINTGVVTFAELTIGLYGSTSTIAIDIIANWEDLTGLISDPFDTGTTIYNTIFTVTPAMLGLTSFADGVYIITYSVGNGTTYANSTIKSTVTYNLACYCNIECCIDQRLTDIPTYYDCESCDNAYIYTTQTLWMLLQALKLAACCASIDKFNNILLTLQTACEDAGCNCS